MKWAGRKGRFFPSFFIAALYLNTGLIFRVIIVITPE